MRSSSPIPAAPSVSARLCLAGSLLLVLCGFASSAHAFPARPVRMIVPFAPGGGSDIVGRVLAQGLTDLWGQSVVVDNRPGAGSTVGTAIAARALPDAHTILVSSSAIVFSPALYKQLPFDITRDFAAVSLLARQPSVLVVAAGVPARSVKELVELARAKPGSLSFGSAGTGSATHLGGELFRVSAGIEMVHVPYKSAGQAMTALLAGETQVLLTNTATVLSHVKSGRVRALAVSGPKRSMLTPELPTVAESGLSGFEYDTWYAMLAPAAVHAASVRQLHLDALKVLQDKRFAEMLTRQGLELVGSSPEALSAYLKAEIAKWARVIREAGLKPQ